MDDNNKKWNYIAKYKPIFIILYNTSYQISICSKFYKEPMNASDIQNNINFISDVSKLKQIKYLVSSENIFQHNLNDNNCYNIISGAIFYYLNYSIGEQVSFLNDKIFTEVIIEELEKMFSKELLEITFKKVYNYYLNKWSEKEGNLLIPFD